MYIVRMKCEFEECFRSLKLEHSISSFGTFLDQHEILSLNNKQQIMSIQPFVYSLAFTFKKIRVFFLIYPVEEMYSSVGGLDILTSSQLLQDTLYQLHYNTYYNRQYTNNSIKCIQCMINSQYPE